MANLGQRGILTTRARLLKANYGHITLPTPLFADFGVVLFEQSHFFLHLRVDLCRGDA